MIDLLNSLSLAQEKQKIVIQHLLTRDNECWWWREFGECSETMVVYTVSSDWTVDFDCALKCDVGRKLYRVHLALRARVRATQVFSLSGYSCWSLPLQS